MWGKNCRHEYPHLMGSLYSLCCFYTSRVCLSFDNRTYHLQNLGLWVFLGGDKKYINMFQFWVGDYPIIHAQTFCFDLACCDYNDEIQVKTYDKLTFIRQIILKMLVNSIGTNVQLQQSTTKMRYVYMFLWCLVFNSIIFFIVTPFTYSL